MEWKGKKFLRSAGEAIHFIDREICLIHSWACHVTTDLDSNRRSRVRGGRGGFVRHGNNMQ